MSTTIGETISKLQNELRDYIEATYHISDPFLIEQRRNLLNSNGVIHQLPFLESTPKYQAGKKYSDSGLDSSIFELFQMLSGDQHRLIYDPPYTHQAQAVEKTLVEGRDIVVMTGTGSGKTECFLLPILGKLIREATNRSNSFSSYDAVRAIIMYPMNALVNDQLGRLRLLLGDKRVIDSFQKRAGRPARFARYTSRTLYPGIRTTQKDQTKLKPIKKYYIQNLIDSQSRDEKIHNRANTIINELRIHGKWPIKENLQSWYGKDRERWEKNGEFVRCNTMQGDAELLTRHEVQTAPPDILVTNYSMLEYMLMRPIESSIFDKTRIWLHENPNEKLFLIIDEAHLYRGASGAEVALLLRRLRARLSVNPDRILAICTSASFDNPKYACDFAAGLTGKDPSGFDTVTGDRDLHSNCSEGTESEAEILAAINIDEFYKAEKSARLTHIEPFLEYRGVKIDGELHALLYEALQDFSPLGRLVNFTMGTARSLNKLSKHLFPNTNRNLADRATTVLIALGSLARKNPQEPGLLPCRIHSFFRGLPGLWVCLNPNCSEVPQNQRSNRNNPTGRLFSQPRDICGCGARVFELYTCRNCGTAYARAYTDNLDDPRFLWNEMGSRMRTETGEYSEMKPIDILLQEPSKITRPPPVPFDLDIVTGRANVGGSRENIRQVYLQPQNHGEENTPQNRTLGQFFPCAVCNNKPHYGYSPVQDHQTSGDQPFQALVTKQIDVQPPGPQTATQFAPLRGRKTLIFSDSRQTAARLAPNLKNLSMRDALRPLLLYGFNRYSTLEKEADLDYSYLAILIAAHQTDVRIRPEVTTEDFANNRGVLHKEIEQGLLENPSIFSNFAKRFIKRRPPVAILSTIYDILFANYYGLEELGLASIVERVDLKQKLIEKLPKIPGLVENDEQKIALVRNWIRSWKNPWRIWLSANPDDWRNNSTNSNNRHIQTHSTGIFKNFKQTYLSNENFKQTFKNDWLPTLLNEFCIPKPSGEYMMYGENLTLMLDGKWAYCQTCRTVQRPFPGRSICVNCGHDTVETIDLDTNEVFKARKGYYRNPSRLLLNENHPPVSLIAEEHTAQLNAAQIEEVFSKAEEYELLFQDVNLDLGSSGVGGSAIDVLSCTTTMEVGIDIGNLSGVALRNMPPGRANYQQRAGRAGRRANAVATVIGYASSDSHDEHYFRNPEEMISGSVQAPRLTLDNLGITKRHVTAFLLQRYHQVRCKNILPSNQPADLFSVLGSVNDFRNQGSLLNINDLEEWLRKNEAQLCEEIDDWLPNQLSDGHRNTLLEKFISLCLEDISNAIKIDLNLEGETENNNEESLEIQSHEGDTSNFGRATAEKLLNRLLYKGVLPRYAFPTDVANFYIFDTTKSKRLRKVFEYTPSQGLVTALSQYAPGKHVWIDGKLWQSGAIYSPIPEETLRAWESKRLYFECSHCQFAMTKPKHQASKGEVRNCPACESISSFGPARWWMRPPGFAHPCYVAPLTRPEDQPARSYATRAKLETSTGSETDWTIVNEKIRTFTTQDHLLVTNRGPKNDGYNYCVRCGTIEPIARPSTSRTISGSHPNPIAGEVEPDCPGGRASQGIVLGTDFLSDILLISLSVNSPISLGPGLPSTEAALRTLCEALDVAATKILNLEPGEIQAEFRPALTEDGVRGLEAEIYLYDTLPGGAGFSPMAGLEGIQLFERALMILEDCPDNCDRSCYRCLRSYKNKFEHEHLDRFVGAELLQYLIHNKEPRINSDRESLLTEQLFKDIARQELEDITVRKEVPIEVPGIGQVTAPILITTKNSRRMIVGLCHSLTQEHFSNPRLNEIHENSGDTEVFPANEILVRRNLPAITSKIIDELT